MTSAHIYLGKGWGAAAMACSLPLDTYIMGHWHLHLGLLHLVPLAPVQKGCPTRPGAGVTLLPCEVASGIPHRSPSALMSPWGTEDEQLLTC